LTPYHRRRGSGQSGRVPVRKPGRPRLGRAGRVRGALNVSLSKKMWSRVWGVENITILKRRSFVSCPSTYWCPHSLFQEFNEVHLVVTMLFWWFRRLFSSWRLTVTDLWWCNDFRAVCSPVFVFFCFRVTNLAKVESNFVFWGDKIRGRENGAFCEGPGRHPAADRGREDDASEYCIAKPSVWILIYWRTFLSVWSPDYRSESIFSSLRIAKLQLSN
jgi:hypothetical protein